MAKEFTYKAKAIEEQVNVLVSKLETLRKSLTGVMASKADPKVEKSLDGLEHRLSSLLTKAKTPIRNITAFSTMERDISSIDTAMKEFSKELDRINKKTAREKVAFTTGDDNKRLTQIISLMDRAETLRNNQLKASAKLEEDLQTQKQLTEAVTEAQKRRDELKGKENRTSRENQELAELGKSIQSLNGQLGTLRNSIQGTQNAFDKNKETLSNLKKESKEAGISLEHIGSNVTENNLDKLTDRLSNLLTQALAPFITQMQSATEAQNEFNVSLDNTAKSVEKDKQVFIEQNAAAGQVDGITSRIKQFTGLTGVALVMRRALNGAIETTKELDAQMTAMAVVTDLKVGDYWKQLPEHTARANALGVAIKDVYEAETLYYQQGLKTAEVTALSTQTLKMARIAGLSAAEATNKMTAALRGFNMEITEANAQNIADVYSKLAAITASDVEEISTAMTKTASLASNAGMQFETTAAFLAQIIETTRESAETAGTALKTVIARFQELKKSPEEMDFSGENEGANKIESALRSVGVALRDARGQFRDLDEVFLELASKWDTLDTNTQRYIATIAAGSRQQSRFIAMMSNYGRTQELVSAANNAAGASNEQFQKTLDSLQSKLEQLSNAWKTFTQGIANSSLIKIAVETLTKLLGILNNLTNSSNSFVNMASKIAVVTVGLTAGDRALKAFTGSMRQHNGVLVSLIKGLQGTVSPLTSLRKNIQSLNQIKKINTLDGTTLSSAKNAMDQYTQAVQKLNDATAQYKAGNINIEDATQASTEAQVAMNQALSDYATTMGLSNSQAEIALALSNKDVTEKEIAIVAAKGYTKAQIDEMAAADGVTVAEEIKKLATAQSAKTALGAIISSKLKAAAARLEALGLGQSTVATWLQTTANKAMTVSLGELLIMLWPIYLAVVALAAAIIGIVVAYKALKANSPEAKLQAATEALNEARQAADDARESYEALNSAWETLGQEKEGLNDLVVGTKEWRDQLFKVNEQVLDLIEKYPELQEWGGIITGDYGELMVDPDVMGKVLEYYSNRAAYMQSGQIGAQIHAIQVKQEQLYTDTLNALPGIAYNGVYTRMPLDQLSQYDINKDSNEIKEILKDTYRKAYRINENVNIDDNFNRWYDKNEELITTTLQNYRQATEDYTHQIEGLNSTLVSSAVALLDASQYSSKKLKQGANVSLEMIEAANQKASQTFDSITDYETGAYANYWHDYYKDAYKVDVQKDGSVRIKQTADDKWTTKFDAEAAKANYVQAESAKELAKTIDHLTRSFSTLTDKSLAAARGDKREIFDLAQAYQNAFADAEGLGLSQANLKALEDGQALATLWNSQEVQLAFNKDQAAFEKEMQRRMDLATAAFSQNATQLTALGLEALQTDTYITALAEKGLISQLEQILYHSGNDAARLAGQQVNDLIQHLSEDSRQTFIEQFNALTLSSIESIEGFSDTLVELGIILPTQDVDDLEQSLIKFGQATSNVKLDTLIEQTQTLMNSLDALRSGAHEKTYTQEEVDAYISANPALQGDFKKNNEGKYTYTGGTQRNLFEQLYGRSTDQIAARLVTLFDQQSAASVKDRVQERYGMDLADVNTWPAQMQKKYLEQFIKEAQVTGTDLRGIHPLLGLSTKVEQLSSSKVAEILQSILGLDSKTIQDDINKAESVLYSQALSQGSYYNARSTAVREAESRGLEPAWLSNFKISREAIIAQAEAAGITDAQLTQLKEWIQQMKSLEAVGDTASTTYNNLLKGVTKGLATISKTTAYQVMYNGLKENISQMSELIEQYENTESVMKRIQLVNEMVDKFGIKATEENYTQLATLVYDLTNGSETALKTIVDLSGQELFEISEGYAALNGKTEEHIARLGQQYLDFAKYMSDMGYGRWDAETETFWFGSAELPSIIDEIGKAADKWYSPYDWLWNATKQINAQLRERNQLEREYNQLLDQGNASYADLAKNIEDQFNKLNENTLEQQNVYDQAKTQLEDYIKRLSEGGAPTALQSLIGIGPNGRIALDKEKLFELGLNTDQGGVIEEQVSKIESLIDTMNSAQDAINENSDAVRELAKTGRQEYLGLVDRVADALRNERQAMIDKMSDINDAINDTQQKIADKIQEKIDDDRQARDDAKTRKNLEDQAANIAYLQASGADPLQVLKAQKELSDAQESYQDQLVDRSLQELQDANQKAADQRQEQIEIMQAQYDWWSDNHAIHEAENMVNTATEEIRNGLSPIETEIWNLLYSNDNVKAQTALGIEDWDKEFNNSSNLASIFGAFSSTAEGTLGGTASSTLETVGTIEKAITEDYNKLGLGNAKLLTQDDLRVYNSEWKEDFAKWRDEWNKSGGYFMESPSGNDTANGIRWSASDEHFKNLSATTKDYANVSENRTSGELLENKVVGTAADVQAHLVEFEDGQYLEFDNGDIVRLSALEYSQSSGKYFLRHGTKVWNRRLLQYDSGGLADFTGPAWLDGTKSAPEMVLNSTDTANLISLKDILGDILRSSNDRQSDQQTGNNYYDINIQVDSIDNDYDIDQAANRIRELIEEDAMYRNVNAVRQIR